MQRRAQQPQLQKCPPVWGRRSACMGREFAYVDASEVIRESLRRWKEQEEAGWLASDWLEQELQEGLDSASVQVSPIRALINRKSVVRSGYSLPVTPRLQNVLPGPIRTCVFSRLDSVSARPGHCPTEAIRSVTHLVLALGGHGLPTSNSNRKERAGRLLPGSLRLGFLGHQSSTPAAPSLASRSGTGLAPNPGIPGSRKLSVPGRVHSEPESCGFRRKGLRLVQPVVDSRHGRIACKTVLPLSKEQRAAPSNQNIGLKVQPRSWLRAALEIHLVFIVG